MRTGIYLGLGLWGLAMYVVSVKVLLILGVIALALICILVMASICLGAEDGMFERAGHWIKDRWHGPR